MGTATNLNPTKYGQLSGLKTPISDPQKFSLAFPRRHPEGKKGGGGKLGEGGEMYTCRKFSGLGLWRRGRKKPLAFLLAHKMAAAGWRPGERERG